MIVCVCKSVSDRKIRASIAEGVDSFDELQFELGVASCCGKCADSVRDVRNVPFETWREDVRHV
jgi:bacterioferritin-associated ferredoxin